MQGTVGSWAVLFRVLLVTICVTPLLQLNLILVSEVGELMSNLIIIAVMSFTVMKLRVTSFTV